MPALDKLTIQTPEHVALEFPLAGAGSRFIALAVDTAIQGAVLLALALAMAAGARLRLTSQSAWGTWLQASVLLAGFLAYYGYFAAFEIAWSGQTPGKRAAGLRVVTADGRPISAFDAIIRNLLRIVDQLPGIYAVGIISMFITARHQRLGDLAAGTVVVHEVVHEVVRSPAPIALQAPAGSARLGAAALAPQEIVAVERFLARRDQLPAEPRERTARQLASHLRTRLSLARDTHPHDERLLEVVAAEYRATVRSR